MIDLACLAQRLRAGGQTLWLSGPQPHVLRMMEAIGLHRLAAVRIAGVTRAGLAAKPAVA